MKKFAAMLLGLTMAFALVGCGGGAGNEGGGAGNGGASDEGDALSRMTAIWDNYSGEKFACFGGNMGESATENAPGKFDVSDKDGMTYTLLIPESVQANVDDAASLIHMMNANTYTSAVVHVTNGDAAGAAGEIKDAILNNQFMCGFPERVAVLTSGDYVLYAFGEEAAISAFVDTVNANVDGAAVVYNEPF